MWMCILPYFDVSITVPRVWREFVIQAVSKYLDEEIVQVQYR